MKFKQSSKNARNTAQRSHKSTSTTKKRNVFFMHRIKSTTYLDFRRIDNDAVGGQVIGIVGFPIDGAQRGDDSGGGLEAAEEGGDKDAVDRKGELLPELVAGGVGADVAVVGERRVPGARRGGRPERHGVVEAIAVAHYDDVLAQARGAIAVGQTHQIDFGGKRE